MIRNLHASNWWSRILLVVFIGLVGVGESWGANFFPSSTGGNWNAGGSWNATACNGAGGFVIPQTTADVVTIGTCAKTITVNSGTQTCGALTINGGTLVV